MTRRRAAAEPPPAAAFAPPSAARLVRSVGGTTPGVSRHAFKSSRVAPPDGAYSAGVSYGNLVAVSAQLPVDTSGEVVAGGSAVQADAAFANLRHQLTSIGLSLDHVVSLRVYLVDESDMAAVDAAVGAAFDGPYPARTVVGVAWLPGGARLQVEALAARH